MPPSNSTAAEIAPSKASFRLKGGLFPLALLELQYFDPELLQQDLQKKIAEAPGFFQQTPVIIGLEAFAEDQSTIDLMTLQQILRKNGMLAVALKGADELLMDQAKKVGLAIMASNTRHSSQKKTVSEPAVTATTENPVQPPQISAPTNKIITTPVRSGQQVYAPGGDLIVLAPVSAGAEILADGNIHVYAPLRGRALAGVQGNEKAQVFCQSLEAELISIAGHFKLLEDLKSEHWKQMVRISLQAQTLCIHPLVNPRR